MFVPTDEILSLARNALDDKFGTALATIERQFKLTNFVRLSAKHFKTDNDERVTLTCAGCLGTVEVPYAQPEWFLTMLLGNGKQMGVFRHGKCQREAWEVIRLLNRIFF